VAHAVIKRRHPGSIVGDPFGTPWASREAPGIDEIRILRVRRICTHAWRTGDQVGLDVVLCKYWVGNRKNGSAKTPRDFSTGVSKLLLNVMVAMSGNLVFWTCFIQRLVVACPVHVSKFSIRGVGSHA